MPGVIEYLADEDVVLVRTSGTYAFESETETVRAAVAELGARGCARCLFDHRAARVLAESPTVYARPGLYVDLGLDRGVRGAIVLHEIDDRLRFYEDVCRNRGWDIQVFDDYEAALRWLTDAVDPP